MNVDRHHIFDQFIRQYGTAGFTLMIERLIEDPNNVSLQEMVKQAANQLEESFQHYWTESVLND